MAETQTTPPAADKKRLPKVDPYILGCYILLCVVSVIELYSASAHEVRSDNILGPLGRHCCLLGGGILLCMYVSRLRLRTFIPLAPIFTIVSVIMAIYVLINGQTINGATRSFSLLGIQIQPAEFLKISAVLIIAYIMARNQEKGGVKNRAIIMSVCIVTLFGALLFTQGLTNTILLMGISMVMLLVGGVQLKKFAVLILIYGMIGGGALYFKTHGGDNYSKEEITNILQTGRDLKGNKVTLDRAKTVWLKRMERFNSDSAKYTQPIDAYNRQEMYGYMAQAHGGFFGVGPGNSRETARLPLAFSDYIYSILVEDLGFFGGFLLLGLYLTLLARAGIQAWRCDRVYPALLIMGMAVMIVFQAMFHMAIVTGVFPVSGQPLPMISKGGTSIMITSLAFGIMLAVSRYTTSLKDTHAAPPALDLPKDMSGLNPNKQ